MKHILYTWWQLLSQNGVTDAMDTYKYRRIVVLNRLNFIAGITAAVWFLFSLTHNYHELQWLMPFLNLLPLSLNIAIYLMVRNGKAENAIIAAFVTYPVILTAIAISTLKESTLIFHIILCVLPFFFFFRINKIVYSLLYTVSWYTFTWIYIHYDRLQPDVILIGLFNYVGLTLLFATLYSIKMQLHSYEKSLKEKRDELNKKNTELNGLLQLKDKIFAVISHDVKTPLTSVKLLLNNFNSNEISKEEMANFNRMLLSETTKTLDLFDNLLEWSKAELHEGGTEKSNFKPYYLTDATLLLMRSKSKYKNISVENTIDRDLLCYANAAAIQVVIRNLLSNAVKFTDQNGHISINASTKNENICIHIKDTGIGMDEVTVDKVMGTQFISRSGTMGEEGHGLGLKICTEFVKQNNGRLICKSKKNEGTEFIIELPKARIKNNHFIKAEDDTALIKQSHPNDQYKMALSHL
jgi:signal transduction histidine kinase